MKGLLVISVICLAIGVGLIFGYCSGTAGLSFGDSLSGSTIHIDITTAGIPMLCGVVLTGGGTFLLVIAWVIAFIGLFQRNEMIKKHSESLQE